MEIIEVTKEEYSHLVAKPFSKFDTVNFAELNKHKVDEVKYFVFNNGKNRFALIGGIKDKFLKCPFSATFSCLTNITCNNKISYYDEAVKALINYANNNNISIEIDTAPLIYDIPHITKFHNALLNNNFTVKNYDVNFEFFTDKFDENYLQNINKSARQNYNYAVKYNLSFKKTDNFESVYNVIKINREEHGYPLWLSLDDVEKTSQIIPIDLFLAENNAGIPIASAIVYHIKDNIAKLVYWGHLMKYKELKPVNFLSYNIFKYYNEKGIKIVDIGTSTLNSIPNYGLCDFKESIGCQCSPKISWRYENN